MRSLRHLVFICGYFVPVNNQHLPSIALKIFKPVLLTNNLVKLKNVLIDFSLEVVSNSIYAMKLQACQLLRK